MSQILRGADPCGKAAPGLAIEPITEDFAAEIGDVDLSRPLDPATADAILSAFARYAVLIFPDQHLSADQHLAFAQLFGPLETSIATVDKKQLRLDKHIADVSNIAADDTIWGERSEQRLFQLANRLWHTDSSFKRLPAKASLLYAVSVVPVGGHTEFADLRAAYDALPDATKQEVEGLVADHCIATSRARLGVTEISEAMRANLPPVPQRVVRTIPETGRRSLYLASHAGRVHGLDDAAGAALLERLTAHATQRRFVYTHRWRVNDLVIWDDRCSMHRGTQFDDLRHRRDMRRATVSDIANTLEQPEPSRTH